MSCKICLDGASKYKCPACRIPYCSVPCWKIHKNDGCGKEAATPACEPVVEACTTFKNPSYLHPTEDTVSPEQLQLLGNSEQMKKILCNPHVRTILSSLDNATNPSKVLHDAMQEPIFVEFVDECMKTLYPPSEKNLDDALFDSL